MKTINFQGQLCTCERLPEVAKSKPTEYIVRLGGRPLDHCVAEQLEKGGYFTLLMKDTNDCRYESQGDLTVFMIKQVREYFQNGWRVGVRVEELKQKVFFGGRPLNTCVGEFFDHPNKRTFYDRGWFELSFVQKR